MLGLHRLAVVDVHRQVVVLYPLLWDSLQFPSDRIFSDLDTGHRHEGLSCFELLSLLWS
jgi:hypothetical protein